MTSKKEEKRRKKSGAKKIQTQMEFQPLSGKTFREYKQTLKELSVEGNNKKNQLLNIDAYPIEFLNKLLPDREDLEYQNYMNTKQVQKNKNKNKVNVKEISHQEEELNKMLSQKMMISSMESQ